ncbi:carboxypeptidase-like regulatory domain-containing protein [Capnocytophaga endodontalis]|uniref:carboxypeptidase-like regulatory domain-containing protein n=1 Tax=Capnocytophaga endodontalis TaxID=2708117 RepID=UPI0012FCEEC9|nr:carboxypeptidase-like regulatory domain-containing protein [Capnocytophaga endodontalis]
MKNIYSFWAIFCLFTLFVISCSKDDETTAPVGTQTSTNQTGTTTNTTRTGTTTVTTQTGTTTNTTQTSTTTNTTQTAIVEVIVSGEVNGINLKVTDAPANQNPKTIANVSLKNANTKFEANKHIGKTLYFVLEKNGMPVSDVVEKEIRAGENTVNLTVKKKKEDGKAAVNIKVTQDGKPVANKKVYGVGGSFKFESITNLLERTNGNEDYISGQVELTGNTNNEGIVRFIFTPEEKNITDYHFFILTEEAPFYLSVDVNLDGSLKEATINIPKKVTVTFVVTDSENETVENATVNINNISLNTDSKGRVMIPLAMATYDYSVTLPCGTNKKGNITISGDKTENVKFTTAERGQVIVENKTDKKCTVKFKGQNYELEAGATKVFMNQKVYNNIYDIDFYVNGNRVEKLYNGMLTCSQKKITFTLNPEDIK